MREIPQLREALNGQRAYAFRRFAHRYYYLKFLPRRDRRALQRTLIHLQKTIDVPRHVARKLATSIAGAALLLTIAPGANAATIIVTTNKPGIKADGKCSLLEAVINANDDTVTHSDCAAGDGTDTIVLPTGTTITFSANPDGNPVLPSISSEITIEANGSKITRKKSKRSSIFVFVDASGNLTVNNAIIAGFNGGGAIANSGTTTLFNVKISGNSDTVNGGAIYNMPNGLFSLGDSSVSGNTAPDGGAIVNKGTMSIRNSTISDNLAIYGGSISNFDGTVTITNSTIAGNRAIGRRSSVSAVGGAIYSRGGYITIIDSNISENSARGFTGGSSVGGGISLNGGYAVIRNSTISENKALSASGVRGFGGAIATFGTTLLIENSLLSSNTAASGPGKNAYGGGFFNGGVSRMLNSTISGNRATAGTSAFSYGGAVINRRYLTITDSTITANEAFYGGGIRNDKTGGVGGSHAFTQLAITRSIVSGNQATIGPEVHSDTPIGNYIMITDDRLNVFGTNNDAGVVGFNPDTSDIIPASGMMIGDILSPLVDNGGPTLTHALVAGSPAIDAAPSDSDCPPEDQRGISRPQGGGCDIGAFEK